MTMTVNTGLRGRLCLPCKASITTQALSSSDHSAKTLFPALRVGYVVLPAPLIDSFLGLRYRTDFRNSSFDQAVLCDFIVDGHLARHLRRMRILYAERLATLMEGAKQDLGGLLEISNVRAGLYTIGYLKNGMTSRQAEKAGGGQGR